MGSHTSTIVDLQIFLGVGIYNSSDILEGVPGIPSTNGHIVLPSCRIDAVQYIVISSWR